MTPSEPGREPETDTAPETGTAAEAETPAQDAQRIADHGREALLSRLRPAFQEAAREHADVLELDEQKLEEMVQGAVDRADGLQWRRALATVASEQLHISLGAALTHPVVARAQEILGVQSYEDGLKALGIPEPEVRSTETDPGENEEALGEQAPEKEGTDEEELGEEAPPPDQAAQEGEAEPASAPAPDDTDDDFSGRDRTADPGAPQVLRLDAVHLGGIANLASGEKRLELRIGSHGLDIARKPGRVIGRLRWREIKSLEVLEAKGLRRRRRVGQAHLMIRTEHGDATFEIPAVSEEQLREALAPLLAQHAAP